MRASSPRPSPSASASATSARSRAPLTSPSSAGVSRRQSARPPNGSRTSPSRGELAGRVEQPARRRRRRARRPRGSAASGRGRRPAPRRLQPLVDQPLVRGVLVDDHHAVGGLGDQVGLVQLRPGDAERQVGLGLGGAAAARPAPRPSRRSGSAKPGAAGRTGAQSARSTAGRSGRGGGARKAPSIAPPVVLEPRWPAPASTWRSAPTTRPRTRPGSRKRTSALAGCTLTSTASGSQVEEQRRRRVAVAGEQVGVGGPQRAERAACRAPVGR